MKSTLLAALCCTVSLSVAASGQIRVSCVGDSITAGVGATSGNSYPSQLGRLLGSGYNVGNFGHSGATLLSTGDTPYIKTSEYTNAGSFNPNIVVIMLGTNDSKDANWANHSTFSSDYAAMIAHYRALSSHPQVYVITAPYMYGTGFGGNSSSVLNNQIAPLEVQIAADNNAPLADVHTATSGHPEWFPGVHPNDAGAGGIAAAVEAAILGPEKYEAELLTVAGSTGPGYHDGSDVNMSGDEGVFLDANAVGNSLTLLVPSLFARSYNVKIGVKKLGSRGIYQLAIGQAGNNSPVPLGSPQDLYSASTTYVELNLGTWTPATSGDKWFRFTVTGKNASSSGYGGGFDYIVLTPQ